MALQAPLRCSCGQLRGVATGLRRPRELRLVCMCDDCQTFFHYLGREELLDPCGGFEAVLITPQQLSITEGTEHLRCARLSPKGTLRWYAGCCRTPLGNSLARPGLAFATLSMAMVDPSIDENAREELFGPVVAKVNGRYSRLPLGEGAHPKSPIGVVLGSGWRLLRSTLARRNTPSPFYDERAQLRVEPEILALDERRRLHQEVLDAIARGA